ncbi:hypothetical protein NP493_1456g00034 [Ridgeia piscesae]|uniref:GAF domain-containing protein n=1 Tax=Ridgeia piscesae TaxID=27915 RepID=A0AAD9K273_RIDPI|nr:hypothetical protein NP493_1456g00034 [Ridgeia piscesae]
MCVCTYARTYDCRNLLFACCRGDPRYKDHLDRMVGYSTDSLLSMPIRSADGDIIGVVQVINKNTVEGVFTKDDEKALLEVVHDLFEEQTSVDHVVTTIMQRAQSLLKFLGRYKDERFALWCITQRNALNSGPLTATRGRLTSDV